MSFIDLGSWKPYLWNIILAPISHPIGIFFLLPMHSKYLQWSLKHSKILVDSMILRIETKKSPSVFEAGNLSCGQSHPTLLGGTEEGGDQGDLERDLESENLG